MKVTALIPDLLVKEVTHYAKGQNLTESLILALRDWLAQKKLRQLNRKIAAKPFEFKDSFSADKVRQINRTR
jgi:hypothetical protein